MAIKLGSKKTRERSPKARKFYIINFSTAHKLADFEIENIDVLLGGALTLDPPPGKRGFPVYPEKPRVVIGKRKSGPVPSDLEICESFWLISDRLKDVFESVDPSAFAFHPCDVRLRDGSAGPILWLCDVVRVLEAFGEQTLREVREYRRKTGFEFMGFSGEKDVVFNESVVGDAHIFTTPYSYDDVFCDENMKEACKAASTKGVSFTKC
jgi:Immunity protein family (Imm11)